MYSDDRYQSLAKHTRHYENMPFEVPEGWEWCQVSDIFELNPKNDVPDDTQSGFIPMACVDDGFGYAHSFETRLWGEIRKGYSHFQNGDIGIAKISPCFENRKSTIFYDLPNGIGAGTTELTVLRGYCVNTEFYLYLFQSEWYIFEGTKEFKGVVGQQRVNKEIFTTLLIPLPPIEEQNRIVTKIKKWFSLIDTLETAKEDLQTSITQVKSKILNLAIHGKLVPQDPNDEPAIELLKRINPKFTPCDNGHDEKKEIPDSWIWCTLHDSFNITMGSSPTGDALNREKQGVEFHQGKVFFSNKNILPSDIYTTQPVKMAEPHSILLCVRAPVGTVNITDRQICIGRGLCSLMPSKSIDLQYAYYVLQTCSKELEQKATGSTFKAVSGDIVKKQLIPFPPYNEQLRIVKRIEELFAVLDEIQKSIEA